MSENSCAWLQKYAPDLSSDECGTLEDLRARLEATEQERDEAVRAAELAHIEWAKDRAVLLAENRALREAHVKAYGAKTLDSARMYLMSGINQSPLTAAEVERVKGLEQTIAVLREALEGMMLTIEHLHEYPKCNARRYLLRVNGPDGFVEHGAIRVARQALSLPAPSDTELERLRRVEKAAKEAEEYCLGNGKDYCAGCLHRKVCAALGEAGCSECDGSGYVACDGKQCEPFGCDRECLIPTMVCPKCNGSGYKEGEIGGEGC